MVDERGADPGPAGWILADKRVLSHGNHEVFLRSRNYVSREYASTHHPDKDQGGKGNLRSAAHIIMPSVTAQDAETLED